MSVPGKIPQPVITNFGMLHQAFLRKDVALVSAIRKQDGQNVFLLAAMSPNPEDNTITPVPFAEMILGNPFELYEDPTAQPAEGVPASGESPELIAAVINMMKAKMRLWDASTVVERLIGFDVETNGGELDDICAGFDECEDITAQHALALIADLRKGQ